MSELAAECRFDDHIEISGVCEQRAVDVCAVVALHWHVCERAVLWTSIVESHVDSRLVSTYEQVVHRQVFVAAGNGKLSVGCCRNGFHSQCAVSLVGNFAGGKVQRGECFCHNFGLGHFQSGGLGGVKVVGSYVHLREWTCKFDVNTLVSAYGDCFFLEESVAIVAVVVHLAIVHTHFL